MAKKVKKTAEERRAEREEYDRRTAILRAGIERMMERLERAYGLKSS